MNLAKKNKFKYGSLAIGLTVAVVAFVIVLNAVFSALASHFFWYFDMTSGQMYQLSDKTVKYLDEIDARNNRITIYFFADKDAMNQSVSASNSIMDTTMWGMKPIHELALQIDSRYDNVSIEYINIASDPDAIKYIVGEDTYATTNFNSRNILIVNTTYERNADGSLVYDANGVPVEHTEFRLCTRNSFYLFDHTNGYVNAFRGDYTFASTFISLTKTDKPTVYFLSGHGEAVGDTSSDAASSYGNAMALYYLFEESGCNIRKIDLKYDDFDVNDKNSVLVIYAPQRDITSASTTLDINETDKIKTFLAGNGNSMMVFLDSGSVGLSNLSALISDCAGVTVSDTKAHDSGEASVSTDGYSIVGKYADSSSAAYPVVERLLAENMANKLIFRNVYPIIIGENNNETGAIALLPESADAGVNGENASLMTLTETDNDGSVLVCGSAGFASNETLESDIYSNKNLLISVLYEMDLGKVPLNIDVKLIRSEGLDRTEREARLWTVTVSALIPAAVAIVGAVVYVRRKHS